MDTNNNQEEYESLESVEEIDERILNTPAKEQKIIPPTIDDDAQLETFLQFNKSPEVRTDEGLILDLGGEPALIDEGDFSKGSKNSLLSSITGKELEADDMVNPGAFFTIFLVAAAVFGFMFVTLRRTDEMTKLTEEINKLKNKTNRIV
ncbi:hypothetical protein ACFLZK_00855 [Patescibacteria group bacterium]